MTNIREPISYHGLELSIFTDELKPFYLTGDTPLFKVRVHNPGMEKISGKIGLTWALLELRTVRIITIDVPPSETSVYELPREWLYTKGIARYDLKVLDAPKRYAKTSDEELKAMISSEAISIHPLCSYYIRDRETYEYEKAEREERLKLERRLYWFTIAIFIFTVLIFLSDVGFTQILRSEFIKLINNCLRF